MNTQFRKANQSDLAFLLKLEQEAFPAFQQNTKQNLKKSIISHFQEVVIVENSGEKPTSIGAVVLFKYKHSLRIYSIAVLSEYRNKGIGSTIMNYIKEFAVEQHYHSIILEAHANDKKLNKWYLSKGFKKTKKIENYYCKGEHAIKMKLELQENDFNNSKNIIVMNRPYAWKSSGIKAKIISVKEYINNTLYHNNSTYRIFNLCSSYKYQSYGYYVSLLASARGQRVMPNTTTIKDLQISNVIQSVAFELKEFIDKSLNKEKQKTFSLDIYFGQTAIHGYKTLANKLFQVFEAPIFRVNFIKDEHWLIKSIKTLNFDNLSEEQKEALYQFAGTYFDKKRYNYPAFLNYKYDIAVLIDPEEENPPSNKEALEKLKSVANKKGIYVEFITPKDRNRINEFDAIFIRATTNVNHHTYEIARFAYAEGLIVIDDPWSILRCSNKIYQYELFKKHKIKTPNSVVITKDMFMPNALDNFKYPIVLKQPDSAFSLGVIKANDKDEAKQEIEKLFKKTDMLICQEFLYSEFDWRIGILDNTPLYACKYYMAKDHWQIYDWSSNNDDKSGESETLPIQEVPSPILEVAQKATALIGDGLYGVDLKFVNGNVYVIEVNDNPNIDAGIEDAVLKDKLYEAVIDTFTERIEIAKNIRKISLTKNNKYKQ